MTKKPSCKHYWCYEHCIWQGRTKNECVIGRWCSYCGLQQMASVSKWGPITKGYPDMRAALRNR